MMCSSCVPIFSKIKGESLSCINAFNKLCVSLNKKRLDCSFISRTLVSILSRRRNWSRWRKARRADFNIFTCSTRTFSDSLRYPKSTFLTTVSVCPSPFCSFFPTQALGSSIASSTRLPNISSASPLPFCSLTK